MRGSRDDLVDVFLADLGTAPVPEGLTHAVEQQIRTERPRRASRFAPWLAAAAAVLALAMLTGLAWLVAGPGPSPTSALPSPTSTVEATAVPSRTAAWQITIRGQNEDVPVDLAVVDHSGTMTGVAQASSWPEPNDQRPFALQIGPGRDDRSITVSWVGGICDTQATLELAADADTLSLLFPPQGNCDSIGVGFRVDLRFAATVDATTFEGTWSRETATPTPAPSAIGSWDVNLTDTPTDLQMTLHAEDRSGTITDVADTGSTPAGLGSEGPEDLVFGQGRNRRHLLVGWTGSVCDERAVLTLATDGRTFTLSFPARPGCDAMAVGRAVEIAFDRAVDATAFTGTMNGDLVRVGNVAPTRVAFSTPAHGWVGGTSSGGDAIVLETVDGGTAWRVEGLGTGEVGDIGVVGATRALAGRTCPDGADPCRPGLYELDGGGSWSAIGLDWSTRLSFAGSQGAGLLFGIGSPREDSGILAPQIRLTEDGGRSWSAVASPCPPTMGPTDADRLDARTVLVLCEGQGATGGARKELDRSTDGGTAWTRLPDPPEPGTGMGMDVLADGTGWLWGARSPLLETSDGGATWSPLDVADGDVRIVLDADAWGGGAGVALVWDPDRQATLLLQTDDGQAWTELGAFPALGRGG